MGLDSLMAVELRNRLRTQWGVDVPIVTFLEDHSIVDLAEDLGQKLAAPRDRRGAGSRPIDPRQAERMLAQLDQMSDEQVDELLLAALADGEEQPPPHPPSLLKNRW